MNERICTIRLKAKFSSISYVSFHAPTEDKDDSIKDSFYEELENVFDLIPSYDVKLFIGDANA